jgi:hypothetical protein
VVHLHAATIERCWRDAHAVWDVMVTLSPPEAYQGGATKGHWSGNEPLAYIDLETRQVVVNFEMLVRMKAAGSLTGVLAHEIGHHVRFPHTLTELASLILLEKRLIPGLGQSLTNLFYDLLVNERVGRTRAEELCAVYRGFLAVQAAERGRKKKEPMSALFGFYLSVYEELWGRPPGDLLPAEDAARLEAEFPGMRADARMFVQTFYALPSVHQQFVYFCCRFIRYVGEPGELTYVLPMGGDVSAPGVDDFDAVIRGYGQGDSDRALEEAEKNGWLDEAGLDAGPESDPLVDIDKITSHLPGKGQGEFKLALVANHYKRLVDRYLIEIPGQSPPPEPFLPTTLEEWEWGDSPRAIDWTASVLASGPLAAVRPLRRDQLPDEPAPTGQDFPAVEIYLDTSGSMPDPSTKLNAMTLAAQILAASALRKRGVVRGIVYSSGPPLVSKWMYDEETARRFLLHYVGGGTDYPFGILRKSAEERNDVIRVIVSDSDFLMNVRQPGAMEKVMYGAEHSRALVAFLAVDAKSAREALAPALRVPRFRLALVQGFDRFAEAAADLARALLGP